MFVSEKGEIGVDLMGRVGLMERMGMGCILERGFVAIKKQVRKWDNKKRFTIPP